MRNNAMKVSAFQAILSTVRVVVDLSFGMS